MELDKWKKDSKDVRAREEDPTGIDAETPNEVIHKGDNHLDH